MLEPVYKAVERILDENSAWIARPNDEVTRRIALAATIAAHTLVAAERAESATDIEAISADSVKSASEDGRGFWRSCSGCHELNDGCPTGRYSKALSCHLGLGCHECGGIGAIWDTTDYSDFGRYLSQECKPDVEAAPFASLVSLRAANVARDAEWAPDVKPDLAFRGNELAGETGEACNVIKKLERERHGWVGSRATLLDLADELADVVICADLAAMTAGIDLSGAVVRKFNATSEKNGLATRMPALSEPEGI
ncbi:MULTISPECIES: MazG-like family protein [unclassified Chelatococcus]|uniref:MazG-like family protein n=1 Tax=unclassified Chelatococcus TaxID=2638111 RepID=UPI0020C13781|nr:MULTISPECIES: MazG-like family protein [unclassified Chelatococcus]MCO5077310.1 MazG-like family protein [Chelatococcus sp.]